jgi:FtsH-binding integral membrane protein
LNYGLILRVFFFILMGMLLGLSLLAFNIQRIIEVVFTHVFLFFESKTMKMMVLKNLTSHKLRNKMTSIIYSLALGFIIFLIVTYNLQIETAYLTTLKNEGGFINL